MTLIGALSQCATLYTLEHGKNIGNSLMRFCSVIEQGERVISIADRAGGETDDQKTCSPWALAGFD
jgi:hypothetical protein